MSKIPNLLSSKSLYKNKYTEVFVDRLKFNNKEWEQVYLTKPNKKGVAVIPLDEKGIFLVKQYRHPIKTFLWQLPMGMIDLETSEEETAKKELLEEAGIKATKFTKIGSIFAEPGVIDQEEVIYIAENLTLQTNNPEINEVGLQVKHFTFEELKKMIRNGGLKCGFTLSALLLFENKKSSNILDSTHFVRSPQVHDSEPSKGNL